MDYEFSIERDECPDIALEILFAIADIENTDPVDLPPLAEYVQVDALNDLHHHPHFVGTTEFTYLNYKLSIGDSIRIIKSNVNC